MNICENPPAINHHRISNDHQTCVVRTVQIIRTFYNEAHITKTRLILILARYPQQILSTCYVNSGLNNVHQFVTAQSGRYYYTQVLCLPVKDEFLDQTRVTIANTTVSYAYQVIHRDKHYTHCAHMKHYTTSTCSSQTTSAVTQTTRACSGMVQQFNTNKYAKTVVVTSWNTGTWNFLELLSRHLT